MRWALPDTSSYQIMTRPVRIQFYRTREAAPDIDVRVKFVSLSAIGFAVCTKNAKRAQRR